MKSVAHKVRLACESWRVNVPFKAMSEVRVESLPPPEWWSAWHIDNPFNHLNYVVDRNLKSAHKCVSYCSLWPLHHTWKTERNYRFKVKIKLVQLALGAKGISDSEIPESRLRNTGWSMKWPVDANVFKDENMKEFIVDENLLSLVDDFFIHIHVVIAGGWFFHPYSQWIVLYHGLRLFQSIRWKYRCQFRGRANYVYTS